jgi:multidrug efflux pump subunit AcrA (membrane-fusion protein)
MGRNMAVVMVDDQGEERATHRVTYGAKLLVDDGDEVKRGQRLAEWDPYTRPIMTEVEGTVTSIWSRASVMREVGGRGHRHHRSVVSSTGAAAARLRSQAAHHAAWTRRAR